MTQELAVEASIYDEGAFGSIDIGAEMRDGHVDVAEGDQYIVDCIRRRTARLGRPLTIMDIGSGSGVLSRMLADAFPQHRVIANDIARGNLERATSRLSGLRNAEVWGRPFGEWTEPVDIFVSWGTHHHLEHGYLEQIKRLLSPQGCLIIGDEFCPEYLAPAEVVRGRAVLIDGYLFTSDEEEKEYRATGAIPKSVQAREDGRRLALWNWYRYVIDEAVLRKHWDVAVLELQIARDDLTTRFAEEHKTSPLLLEIELRQSGLKVVSKQCLGSRPPELQSFVIYEVES